MMWLTWRQHRVGFGGAAGALVLVTAFVVTTGLRMRDAFASLGLDRCAVPASVSCPEEAIRFQQMHSGLSFAVVLFLVAPVLIGLFWGAPLVAREVEQGTHRLVWTQAVTRDRWLLVKVAVLGAAGAALLGAVTALLAWWVDPVLRVRPERLSSPVFDLIGVVPAAYALAALAIGVAVGTVIRSTVPALGLTLVLFLALRLAVEFGLRPHYQEPLTADTPWTMQIDQVGPGEGAWVLSQETRSRDGVLVSDGGGFDIDPVAHLCPELPDMRPGRPRPEGAAPVLPKVGAVEDCASRIGLHVVTVYHPDDRFWRFQLTEAALYLALSAALVAGSAWWLRHRVT